MGQIKSNHQRGSSGQASGFLTHVDRKGHARMVDVSGKTPLCREALAEAVVKLQQNTLRLIQRDSIGKGNVLAAARLAGIMGAKKTAELIPLCHPLPLTHCEVNFDFPSRNTIRLRASARITDRTGVEM